MWLSTGKCETNSVFYLCECVLILVHKDTKADMQSSSVLGFLIVPSMLKAAKIAFHCCSWHNYQGYLQITCNAIQQKRHNNVLDDLFLEIMASAWIKPCAHLLTWLRTISPSRLFLHLCPTISLEWTTDYLKKYTQYFISKHFLGDFKGNLICLKGNKCMLFFSF